MNEINNSLKNTNLSADQFIYIYIYIYNTLSNILEENSLEPETE